MRNTVLRQFSHDFIPFHNIVLHSWTSYRVLWRSFQSKRAPFASRPFRISIQCHVTHASTPNLQIALNSTKFHNVLKCSILLKKDTFIFKQSLILYCITVYPIPLHSTTFYSFPLHSITFLCLTFSQRRHHSLTNRTGDVYYVTLKTIALQSTTSPSITRHTTTFYCVPFCKRQLHSFPNVPETVY